MVVGVAHSAGPIAVTPGRLKIDRDGRHRCNAYAVPIHGA
jgi:hypothetical protein